MSLSRLWKRVYRIGKSPLLAVHSDSRAALDALELRPVGDVEPVCHSPLLEIFLLGGVIAELARVESPEMSSLIYGSEAVSIRSCRGRHYGSWYGKAASVADPRAGRAIISVPFLCQYHPDFISRYIFRPVLDRLLFDRGLIPIHAAACAQGGRGCLLVGETGTGKTTLLLRLLEEGMGFLADDRALIFREGDRFRLHAYPEMMRIALTGRGRKSVRPAPGPAVFTAEVEMLCFLETDVRGGPGAVRIGTAEAVARMMHSVSPYLELPERMDLVSSIERLCHGTVCSVIHGWGGPGERASLVKKLFRDGISR